MASKQRKATHLIPNSLTHSGGTITAVFDSGTRQVVLSGLTANTLYFLYLRTVSNTPTLFFVTTTPQTYRVSNPDAILIGAFYSNGLGSVGFGSFVNIEGTPTSDWIPFAPTATGMGTGYSFNIRWRRDGGTQMMQGGAALGTGPFGQMIWAMPTNTAIDINRITDWQGISPSVSGFASFGLVTLRATNAGTTNPGIHVWQDANNTSTLTFGSQTGDIITNSNPVTLNANDRWRINGSLFIPISGWTDVPLKDR